MILSHINKNNFTFSFPYACFINFLILVRISHLSENFSVSLSISKCLQLVSNFNMSHDSSLTAVFDRGHEKSQIKFEFLGHCLDCWGFFCFFFIIFHTYYILILLTMFMIHSKYIITEPVSILSTLILFTWALPQFSSLSPSSPHPLPISTNPSIGAMCGSTYL